MTVNNSARTLKNPNLSKGVQPSSDRMWWIGGFVFGFAVGLALSLTYGWVLDPRPRPTTPAELRPSDQATYIRLVALAYAHNHRLDQAQTRLNYLANPNLNSLLIMITEAYINQGRDPRDISALVELSAATGEVSPLMATYLTTPSPTPTPSPSPTNTHTPTTTHTPTNTPTHTQTPRPTSTLTPIPTTTPRLSSTTTLTASLTISPTPTLTSTPRPTATPRPTPTLNPQAPIHLKTSQALCDPVNAGLLRIYIHDRLGRGIPGVHLKIRWEKGEDNIFTGFKKPNLNEGYADFQMKAAETYQVEVVNIPITQALPEITMNYSPLCQPHLPAWQLVLAQDVP